ncbi:SRPBCC domain-containing protein [Microlunatus sp. GCM10028923]|uniref:SRPBCC domain-containing protein n=1 Tax=Microlunatus sp. GCM10028923 TaxID=3273400 RepID=UPI00361A6055
MITALDLIDQVERRVAGGERDGEPTKIVILRRHYDADVDQVWDAFTNAERLPRWFLPVSGDLRLGGRYQFEGNAGGLIESCRRPELIKVTWEYDGGLSWVEVRFRTEPDGRTMIELRHEQPVDDSWRTYGPGAGGVGWDIGLVGLDEHLRTGRRVVEQEWTSTPDGREAIRRSSADWARAAVADGEDARLAGEAADRTAAAYTAES